MTNTKAATEMSEQELEAILAKKKKERKLKREREKKAYEAQRDQSIEEIMGEAERLAEQLALLKQKCHLKMSEQMDELREYGTVRSDSKGGFSITHSDGERRVSRRRDTVPNWDERALKGVQLIREFLDDTVKKRDKKLFTILMSFIERNQQGDLEYAKVMILLQHEDKFTDKRWVEGLALIKEGYGILLKSYGYEFKRMGKDGKWINLVLNFSAV